MRAFKVLRTMNYIDSFNVLLFLFFEPYHNQFGNCFLYHTYHFLATNEEDHVNQGPSRVQVAHSNQITKEKCNKGTIFSVIIWVIKRYKAKWRTRGYQQCTAPSTRPLSSYSLISCQDLQFIKPIQKPKSRKAP